MWRGQAKEKHEDDNDDHEADASAQPAEQALNYRIVDRKGRT